MIIYKVDLTASIMCLTLFINHIKSIVFNSIDQ